MVILLSVTKGGKQQHLVMKEQAVTSTLKSTRCSRPHVYICAHMHTHIPKAVFCPASSQAGTEKSRVPVVTVSPLFPHKALFTWASSSPRPQSTHDP